MEEVIKTTIRGYLKAVDILAGEIKNLTEEAVEISKKDEFQKANSSEEVKDLVSRLEEIEYEAGICSQDSHYYLVKINTLGKLLEVKGEEFEAESAELKDVYEMAVLEMKDSKLFHKGFTNSYEFGFFDKEGFDSQLAEFKNLSKLKNNSQKVFERFKELGYNIIRNKK